ncbi:MAG: family metallopeptidase [Solirubrobacterales bacterium]|nr:family metallopeptidase [Solirubrobacterales bacterium]
MAAGLFSLMGLLAPVASAGAGGASYTPTPEGGSEYGAPLTNATPPKPVASGFQVSPSTIAAPKLPSVSFRIDQPSARTVRAWIVFWPQGSGTVARVELGRVRAGRIVTVSWPAGTKVAPGRYLVRLSVVGRGNQTLARSAGSTGKANLTVRAAKVVAPPPPPPVPVPAATPAPAPLLPAPAVNAGPGVFPVQGLHTYGDPFGAPRQGYTHQGQDILAAEGTPVVAPVAGTISYTGYQASAAGYYVVERGGEGHDFFFAHCEKDSTVVIPGQAVAAGAPLCKVGATGDASGPHLHFEMWTGGWRVSTASQPIDPLPYLQAWDH